MSRGGECRCGGCYACSLRAKGLQAVKPAHRRNHVPPSRANPVWEAGKAGEVRADGSFMPYLTASGARMGVKEFSENRHRITERVKELKTNPHVFSEGK